MITKEKLRIKDYVILNYFDPADMLNLLTATQVHICRINGSYHPFYITQQHERTFLSVAGYHFTLINAFFNFWLNNEFAEKTVFDDTLENDLKKFKKHCKSDNAVMYCCGNNTYNFFDVNEIMK